MKAVGTAPTIQYLLTAKPTNCMGLFIIGTFVGGRQLFLFRYQTYKSSFFSSVRMVYTKMEDLSPNRLKGIGFPFT